MPIRKPDDGLDAFEQARSEFRLVYERGQLDELQPNFSQSTLWRLAQPDERYPSSSFSRPMRERLVAHLSGTSLDTPYKITAMAIDQHESARRMLTEQFVGNYVLYFPVFRDAHRGYSVDGGRLTLFERGDDIVFEQWGPGKFDGPFETSGYAYYSDGKIFIQGANWRGISLIILRASDPRRFALEGMMLCAGEFGARAPLATKVLVIDELNHDMIDQMAGTGAESTFRKLTEGAHSFFEATPPARN